jgi:hypothetical protein
MGYCAQVQIERLYRDARIFGIYDGTPEIHRGIVARAALRQRAALWNIGARSDARSRDPCAGGGRCASLQAVTGATDIELPARRQLRVR